MIQILQLHGAVCVPGLGGEESRDAKWEGREKQGDVSELRGSDPSSLPGAFSSVMTFAPKFRASLLK